MRNVSKVTEGKRGEKKTLSKKMRASKQDTVWNRGGHGMVEQPCWGVGLEQLSQRAIIKTERKREKETESTKQAFVSGGRSINMRGRSEE